MKHRILTLVVKIKNPEDANWIWETHMSGTPQHGVITETITEGNEIERLEKELNNKYNYDRFN